MGFVRCRLNATRNVPPRTEKALNIYEDSILQAITASDEDTRLDCLKEIRGLERLISSKAVFRGDLSEQAEALQLELLKFRELEYMARFGSYFALPLTKLRRLSGKHQTPGQQHISGKHIIPFDYDGPPPSTFCTVGQLPHTVATTTSFVPPSILTDNPSSGESLAHSIAADDQGLAVREDLRRAEEA